MKVTRRSVVQCLPLAIACGLGSCRGHHESTTTERLWVSSLPKGVKAPVAAFLTTRTKQGQYIGAFVQGSLVRGGYDVFEWKTKDEQRAVIRFLQDGRTHELRFETCTPDRAFDYCLLVHGDPLGVKRYQSRKRWTVRRGKKKGEAATIAELPSMAFDALNEGA